MAVIRCASSFSSGTEGLAGEAASEEMDLMLASSLGFGNSPDVIVNYAVLPMFIYYLPAKWVVITKYMLYIIPHLIGRIGKTTNS